MKIIDNNILLRFIAGELTDDSEKQQVLEWINASNDNKSHFNSLVALWQASGRDETEVKNLREKIWSSLEKKSLEEKNKLLQQKNITYWKRTLAVAASIAILLSLSLIFYFNHSPKNNYHTFYADAGSKSKITLSDGTIVYLNSETEIKIPYDFDQNNRNVELIGEAYFDVQKTENKDLFIVKVGDLNINVLGTKFNVKGYPNEETIETTLEKGKVEIEKRSTGKTQKIVALKPNQQAVFIKKKGDILVSNTKGQTIDKNETEETDSSNDNKQKERLILKEQIETNLYTSWKEGKFVFESEPFSTLIIRMQRWYGIKIEIKNDSLKNINFTGTLKNETIEQALDALKMSQTFQYSMDIENNIIYIE